jgi:hypothetical protein
MATSKRVLPESDTPWSLMIISVGKRGEEKQYQQWLERTASTAIDARIIRPVESVKTTYNQYIKEFY